MDTNPLFAVRLASLVSWLNSRLDKGGDGHGDAAFGG
jgi:hypothetical protein